MLVVSPTGKMNQDGRPSTRFSAKRTWMMAFRRVCAQAVSVRRAFCSDDSTRWRESVG